MQRVRQRDIDRLDLRIGQKRVITVVQLEVRGEGAEAFGLGRIGCGQRMKPRALGLVDRPRHVLARETRRTKNPPVDRLHRPILPFAQTG